MPFNDLEGDYPDRELEGYPFFILILTILLMYDTIK